MKSLLKYARNEIVFETAGQKEQERIKVGPVDVPRKTLGTMLGAAVGYTIPTVIQIAQAAAEGREVRTISDSSAIGAGIGAVIGRNLGE